MMMNQDYKSSQYLLSALECMENLVDGVMLVGCQGEVLYMNQMADLICQNLTREKQGAAVTLLPEAVWHTCQTLIEQESEARPTESGQTGDGQTRNDRQDAVWVSSESEIQSYRVRVQRFHLKQWETPCFMVRIEDQQQSLCSRVVAEIQQYGLTQRESEVWRLKRENLSRQEIANQLFISVDTVKKHLHNIQLKRQAYGGMAQSA